MIEKSQLLDKLQDNYPGFFYIFDYKLNNILYASDSFETHLGYTMDELNELSKTLSIIDYLFHPDDNSLVRLEELEFITRRSKAYEGKPTKPQIYRIRTKKRGYKWFEFRTSAYTNVSFSEGISQVLVQATDISMYKNIEDTLIRQLHHSPKSTETSILYIRQLKATLENTPNVAIQWYDEYGNVIYWNKISEKLYGYKAEAMIGNTLRGVVLDEKEYSQFLEILKRVKQSGDAFGPYEVPVKLSGGLPGWVLSTTFLLPLDNNKEGFVCMDIDISLQKQTLNELTAAVKFASAKETELIRLNEEYAAIIEEIRQMNEHLVEAKEHAETSKRRLKQISDSFENGMIYQVVILGETQRKFTYLSESVIKLYGNTPEEIIENESLIYDRIHPDDIDRLIEHELKALANMSLFKQEMRVRNPDGTYRWSLVISNPRRVDDVVFWDGIEVDITDRKKIESEREQLLFEVTQKRDETSKAKDVLNSIMERVSDGFVAFDKDFNYTYVNTQAANLIGATPKDLIGRNYWAEYPETHNTQFAKSCAEALETQQPVIFEEYNIRWNRWFVNRIYPSSEGITMFFTDITERKINEVALLDAKEKAEHAYLEVQALNEELFAAKEKAEESDLLKSAFLNNMSHEVRTPLNAIAGFSQLMTDVSQSPEQLKMYADIISQSTEKLIGIITDVIEVSQVQANQSKVLFTEFDLLEFINLFDKECSSRAAEKNIIFRKIIQLSQSPSKVVTDYEKLKKIVYHLLDNALKFTQFGTVELFCTIQDEKIQIHITDSGIGISESKQRLLFKPFSQIETGITRDFGGNGLGLTLVKSYIDMLHGTIEMKSEVDIGTVMRVSIPARRHAAASMYTKKHLVLPGIKTILIAEDEYYNYLFLKTLFRNTKANLLYAANGKKAVEICFSNPNIDLVFMDIKMPIMDGYTAAKIIKDKLPHLPIIAASAYVLEHEKEAFGDMFDDFLLKPISESDFNNKILKYIIV